MDQLLGSNKDAVSVGEIHWVGAYLNQDRDIYDPVHPLVCSCGEDLNQCEFWQQVADRSGRPLDRLRLVPRFFDTGTKRPGERPISARFKSSIKRQITQNPHWYRQHWVQSLLASQQLARDSTALYDAISDVSGARCIIDSSKSAFRFRSIYDANPNRVRAILLVRDYRAVVHSKVSRGRRLESAALGWKHKVIQMEELTKDLSQGDVFRLKYESLCQDPPGEIQKLCHFLGLEYSETMLVRPTGGIHHLGGSPSKFDRSKTEIQLDQKYLGAFSDSELQKIKVLVGDAAAIWCYD